MIPKIIHYCWFGDNELPAELQGYIDGWNKVFPDYSIKRWDETNFDLKSALPFVKEAYSVKKYAFVADYVRMYALYKEGGLYMDTDICVLKRFDEFMNYRFFTAMEYHQDNVRILNIKNQINEEGYRKDKNKIIYDICVESAIFAAEQGHPFIKDCLDYYENKHFILSDGSYYDKIIVPVIMALCAEKYGFRYVNEFQILAEDIHLFPDDYFTAPCKQTENTLALHMVKNSWVNRSLLQRFYASMASIGLLRTLYEQLEKVSYIRKYFDKLQKRTWLNDR
jgi:Mannosyltransferase OCH1 and related enzymes